MVDNESLEESAGTVRSSPSLLNGGGGGGVGVAIEGPQSGSRSILIHWGSNERYRQELSLTKFHPFYLAFFFCACILPHASTYLMLSDDFVHVFLLYSISWIFVLAEIQNVLSKHKKPWLLYPHISSSHKPHLETIQLLIGVFLYQTCFPRSQMSSFVYLTCLISTLEAIIITNPNCFSP